MSVDNAMVIPYARKAAAYSPPSSFDNKKKKRQPMMIIKMIRLQRVHSSFTGAYPMPAIYAIAPANTPPTANVVMNKATE